MNEGRKQVEEEIRLLEMLKELADNKLKSKFAERELMQRFYYSKEMDYEMTKEILEYQRLYNYVEEWKAAKSKEEREEEVEEVESLENIDELGDEFPSILNLDEFLSILNIFEKLQEFKDE